MISLFWALTGGTTAVAIEAYFRAHAHLSYWQVWQVGIPGAVLVNYAIWRLMTVETLIGAVVLFTASTAVLRVLVTLLVLREPVGDGNWAAFGLVLLAVAVKLTWGR